MQSLKGMLAGRGKPGAKSRTRKKSTRPAKSAGRKRLPGRPRAARKSSANAGASKPAWLNERSLKYLAQQVAPYWTAIAIGGLAALAVALWASGVFYQVGLAAGKQFDRFLIEQGLMVQNVEISGRVFTAKSDMKASMRLESATPFMKYDIHAARRRIETLDWVERATVLRLWPDTIRISLVEKRPIAIWQLNGMFSLIDRKGQVISSDHLADFSNLPHLVGQGAAEHAPEFVDLLSRYPVLNSRLRAALRIGERRWTLRLDNGLDILLPDQKEEQALTLLVALDEKYRLLARQIEVIDMRDRDRLYLRLQNADSVQLDLNSSRT